MLNADIFFPGNHPESPSYWWDGAKFKQQHQYYIGLIDWHSSTSMEFWSVTQKVEW